MNKQFDKIFVHVGFEKTGTSTIQQDLLLNRDILESDHNVFYPTLKNDPRPFKENHSIFLTSLFGKNSHRVHFNLAKGINTPNKLKEINVITLEELTRQFNATTAKTLLLSAEGISSFDLRELKELLDWLGSWSSNIEFICCLRHPEDWIPSYMQQKLKSGNTFKNLIENPPIRSTRILLKCILKCDEHAKIHLYDFMDAVQHKNGLTGKFLEIINIPFKGLKTPELRNSNQSMCIEAALILNALNEVRPKIQGNIIGEKRFAKDMLFYLDLEGSKFQLPSKFFKDFKKEIDFEIRWIQKNFDFSFNNYFDRKIIPFRPKEEALNTLSEITGYDKNWISFQLKREFQYLALKDENKRGKIHELAIRVSDHYNGLEMMRLTKVVKNLKMQLANTAPKVSKEKPTT